MQVPVAAGEGWDGGCRAAMGLRQGTILVPSASSTVTPQPPAGCMLRYAAPRCAELPSCVLLPTPLPHAVLRSPPAAGVAGIHELPQALQLLLQRRLPVAHVPEVRDPLLLAVHVQRAVPQLELACTGAAGVLVGRWVGGLVGGAGVGKAGVGGSVGVRECAEET